MTEPWDDAGGDVDDAAAFDDTVDFDDVDSTSRAGGTSDWTDLDGSGGGASRYRAALAAVTARPVDRSPSRFGSRVAVAVAAVVTLVLGVAVGAGSDAVAAVGGVLVALRGVRRMGERGTQRRAAASLWLTVGAVVAAGGLVAVQYATVVAATVTSLGAFAVAVAGFAGLPAGDRERGAPRLLQVALLTTLVLFCVGLLAHLDPVGRAVRFVAAGNVSFVWTNTMAAFVILQVQALAVLVAVQPARMVVDRWLYGPGGSEESFDALSVRDIRLPYWVVLAVEGVIAVLVPDVAEWVLDQLSVLGTAIRVVLLSGVLHAVLAAAFAVIVAVFLARATQLFLMGAAGPRPVESAAEAVGPVVATVVGAAVLWLLGVVSPSLLAGTGGGLAATLDLIGPVALVAFAVGLTLVAAYAVGLGVELYREATPDAFAFAPTFAGAALLSAAVAASEGGVPALAVFAAVAAAVVVWDASEFAVGLGRQVGAVETRRTELAHLTGTVLVGVVALVVTTVAALLYGRVPTVGEGRASLALALALVAVIALLGLVLTSESDADAD